MELRTQLFNWIVEDSDDLVRSGKPKAVPIHLLLVKLALSRQGEIQGSSASTELSLQVFERSQVFRHLRDLFQQGQINFVNAQAEVVNVAEKDLQLFGAGEPSALKFVQVRQTEAV